MRPVEEMRGVYVQIAARGVRAGIDACEGLSTRCEWRIEGLRRDNLSVDLELGEADTTLEIGRAKVERPPVP